MDAKLETYRLRKRRQAVFDKIKEKFLKMVSFSQIHSESKTEHVIEITKSNSSEHETPEQGGNTKEIYLHDVTPISTSDDEENNFVKANKPDPTLRQKTWLSYATYCVYFLFWATCYVIAIELKFGTVYFLFSALFAVYFNTRTGPKHQNEISAYSVFNKNCHSIDGTLKGEQFEREIRYGPTGVK